MGSRYAPLEAQLGHSFKQLKLLEQALTHRSHSSAHYERLEFLGDSVLNCAASILLYQKHPDLDEGRLSRIRSHLVRQECLASIARALDLPALMFVGTGELRSGHALKDSIVADALEAIFGVILLESGFDEACAVVIRLLTPVLLKTPLENFGKDAKTRLQELLQGRKLKLPQYQVLKEGGTAQSPEFIVDCVILEHGIRTQGRGASRRLAEQLAAELALKDLEILK